MKRILTFAIALFTLTVSGLAQNTVTKTFDFGDFNGIKAGYIHHIYVTEGRSDKIEVTCPEKYAKNLDYSISNGVLNLGYNQPHGIKNRNTKNDEIVVKIQMERMEYISLSGAAELTAEGNFKADEAKIVLSGASKVNGTLNLKANKLDYDMSGAAVCSMEGAFREAGGELSGAAGFYLLADVSTLDIEASGAAKCNYKGKTDSIDIECSGAANIKLQGSTNDIEIECSGAAKVDAEAMTAKNAKASASGASSIRVYADNRLDLQASAASSIKYFGEAKDLHMANQSISRGR